MVGTVMARHILRTRKNERPRVGSQVQFRIGTATLSGVVVEDRGPIGKAGRRLLRIRPQKSHTADEPAATFEMPAEEVVACG